MKKSIVINPFNIQFAVILAILLIYSLGWSKIAQPLTTSFFFFLIFVMISLLIFSRIYNTYFPPAKLTARKFREPTLPWIIIGIASIVAEFAYEKVIPIVEILVFKHNYNYVDFAGIPGFHVFAVTYTSFLGLWLWDIFLEKRKIGMLLMGIFFVSFPLMLFNRGGFIFNVVSGIFIYLYRKKEVTITINKIVGTLIVFLLFSYLFGIFGNFRSRGVENDYKQDTIPDSSYILNVGIATPEFRENSVPKEFFWAYLYVSTPIANLQNIIEKTDPMYSEEAFLAESIMPDFVGKRIIESQKITIPKDKLIKESFNVSTYFSSAYKTMGYIGLVMIVYYFAFFIFGFTYLFMHLETQSVVGMSVLFTISVFCLFSNMMVFSGLSFQLVYPILFGLYKKI